MSTNVAYFLPNEATCVWRTADWTRHLYLTKGGNFVSCHHHGIFVNPDWYYFGSLGLVVEWFVDNRVKISRQEMHMIPEEILGKILQRTTETEL